MKLHFIRVLIEIFMFFLILYSNLTQYFLQSRDLQMAAHAFKLPQALPIQS